MIFDKNDKKNKINHNKNGGRATLFIVRVAIMGAMLSALKFALSFVPNVEVVTLLIIVYGAVLGIPCALGATLVFCAIEVAIYGVQSWVLLYFVYWPLLAIVASLLLHRNKAGKKGVVQQVEQTEKSVELDFEAVCDDKKHPSSRIAQMKADVKAVVIALLIGVLGSVLFGVLSASADTIFCVASLAPGQLSKYWVAYYLRGVTFDLIHVASSVATIAVGYLPLVKILSKIAKEKN